MSTGKNSLKLAKIKTTELTGNSLQLARMEKKYETAGNIVCRRNE
jgi:hypothetical protein